MSGKVYIPTYWVTSRSAGSSSPCSSSSPGASAIGGPGLPDLLVGGGQGFGQHAGLGQGGHEVGVAVPAGHAVHVEVAGNAGAGAAPQVGTHVQAVGRVAGFQR